MSQFPERTYEGGVMAGRQQMLDEMLTAFQSAPAAALVERAKPSEEWYHNQTIERPAAPSPAGVGRAAIEVLAVEVLRYLEAWDDAEERYHAAKPDGKSWADNPNSIGAKFVRGQIASAQDSLRALRDELTALLLAFPSGGEKS